MKHARQLAGLASALVIATGLASGAVQAAGNAEPGDIAPRSVEVRYHDLDLSREAGVQALYGRLAAAAKRVCGPYDIRNLDATQLWRSCYKKTLADAVTDSGNRALAAVHESVQRGQAQLRTAATPVG
jgi:UrcA family protein